MSIFIYNKNAVEGCSDCAKQLPFVRGECKKKKSLDTELYRCDEEDCEKQVCWRHLNIMYTIGDFCAEHADHYEMIKSW